MGYLRFRISSRRSRFGVLGPRTALALARYNTKAYRRRPQTSFELHVTHLTQRVCQGMAESGDSRTHSKAPAARKKAYLAGNQTANGLEPR